jgi:hypothetical protein
LKNEKVFRIEDPEKSHHSRAGGNRESVNLAKKLDSRFHGNGGKEHLPIFTRPSKFALCNLQFSL